MSKTYYDLLGLSSAASAEEIRMSFRREIAKYHPDKVHHLGQEFQEIAAVKASELTLAYKTLTDEGLRAAYDAQVLVEPLRVVHAPTADTDTSEPSPSAPAPPPPTSEPESAAPSRFLRDRQGVTDLVQKAAVARFRHALAAELPDGTDLRLQGFDLACLPSKPPFWSRVVHPYILARVVGNVDGHAVVESWAMASKLRRNDPRDVCVFLMGPAVASAGELASAIADQRRKPLAGGGKLIMIPVNARSWHAHVPNEAPPIARLLLTRLQHR